MVIGLMPLLRSRMKDDAIIVLDPVNQHVISEGLKKALKLSWVVTVP